MSEVATHIEIEKRSAVRSRRVPKLRFKEFEGEWDKSSLEEVIQILSGFAFKSSCFSESGQPLLTPKNFTKDGKANFSVGNTKFTTEIVDEKYLCKSGDLLVLLTDLTPSCELLGKPVVLTDSDGEVLLNQRIIKISVDNTKISKEFLANIFLTETYHRRIKDTATGTTVRHSSNKIIYAYETWFPTLPEQQKIASFLSAVDEKIQQLTKKKELLEQYNKGVMQQLFSGKLRFKDENGNDYPDWEEKRLGEVCESIKSGKSNSSENGVIPLYGSTGIIGKCSESSHQGRFILIARVGANAGTINLIDDNFGVSDNTLVVVCKPILVIGYIYYFLAHYNLNRLVFGSGQPLITGGQLKVLKFKLPNTEEQQKIATYLSAIDIKIESVNNQITQTQSYKKGLLQQMFV